MSEPDPKRRRVGPSTLRPMHLPPDVICSEILPHLQVFNDPDQDQWTNKPTRLFGRFTKDPTRYPWFIFRTVYLSEWDILGAVVRIIEAPAGANLNKVISDFLPAVKHIQILRLICSLHDPRRTDSLLSYFIRYIALRKTINRLPEDHNLRTIFPGVTGETLKGLPKDHHLRRMLSEETEQDHHLRLMLSEETEQYHGLPKEEWSSGYTGWPFIPWIDEFETLLRRVVDVLIQPDMRLLNVLSGFTWLLLVEFDVHLPPESSIRRLDFAGDILQLTFGLMLKFEYPQIQEILNLCIISPGLPGPSNYDVFHRFFDVFRGLTVLDMDRVKFANPVVLGTDFASLIDGRKMAFTTLILPDSVLIDYGASTWIGRVTNRLKICANERGDPVPPYINDELKTLTLAGFGISSFTVTPNKVIFKNCYFPDTTTVLNQRTTEARFLSTCTWTASSIVLSEWTTDSMWLIHPPITLVSRTLVKLYWHLQEDLTYSHLATRLDTLVFNMPMLKHVTILSPGLIKTNITINSESMLDMLYIGDRRHNNLHELHIVVPKGAKRLKLMGVIPKITGLQQGTEKIYLEKPPRIQINLYSHSRSIEKNIYGFEVPVPKVHVWEGVSKNKAVLYEQTFHANTVVFESDLV